MQKSKFQTVLGAHNGLKLVGKDAEYMAVPQWFRGQPCAFKKWKTVFRLFGASILCVALIKKQKSLLNMLL